MTAHEASLAATILLLFPMLYFLIASLTFFLAKLQDPVVTRMLRGLFATYFAAVAGLGTLAGLAFLAAGRFPVAAVIAAAAVAALGARRWFLARLDLAIRARDSGDGTAIRRLRRLHLTGIGYNLVQVVAVVGSIPALFTGR